MAAPKYQGEQMRDPLLFFVHHMCKKLELRGTCHKRENEREAREMKHSQVVHQCWLTQLLPLQTGWIIRAKCTSLTGVIRKNSQVKDTPAWLTAQSIDLDDVEMQGMAWQEATEKHDGHICVWGIYDISEALIKLCNEVS